MHVGWKACKLHPKLQPYCWLGSLCTVHALGRGGDMDAWLLRECLELVETEHAGVSRFALGSLDDGRFALHDELLGRCVCSQRQERIEANLLLLLGK